MTAILSHLHQITYHHMSHSRLETSSTPYVSVTKHTDVHNHHFNSCFLNPKKSIQQTAMFFFFFAVKCPTPAELHDRSSKRMQLPTAACVTSDGRNPSPRPSSWSLLISLKWISESWAVLIQSKEDRPSNYTTVISELIICHLHPRSKLSL